MGRARNNGAVAYDVQVGAEEYRALEARAAEQGTTMAEIVRADLLSPANKERLVPRARKLVRHATINVTQKPVEGEGKLNIPSIEVGLDD